MTQCLGGTRLLNEGQLEVQGFIEVNVKQSCVRCILVQNVERN